MAASESLFAALLPWGLKNQGHLLVATIPPAYNKYLLRSQRYGDLVFDHFKWGHTGRRHLNWRGTGSRNIAM